MNERATDDRRPRASPRPRNEDRKRRILSGRQARQGDIILDTPGKRAWFIGGLAACVILLLVIALVR